MQSQLRVVNVGKLCINTLCPGILLLEKLNSRPKVLCTKAVFYMYILLILVLLVIIVGFLAGAIVFPAYSLYVSPYLPTSTNLNSFASNHSRSFTELGQDLFVYKNFSTSAVHLPKNYLSLLNITIEHGLASFAECSDILEEGRDLLSFIDDVKSLSDAKESVLSSFPSIDAILSGLNVTFSPYYDYLPTQVPLVQSAITFFKAGNYSLAAIKQFTDEQHVFAQDPMELRISDFMELALNPLSLFNESFLQDVKLLSSGVAQNVTDVTSDFYEKSSLMYRRLHALAVAFGSGGDLGEFEEIPAEYLDMFKLLQSKYLFYVDRITRFVQIVPQFANCMAQQSMAQLQTLKGFMVRNYVGYFKRHYFYSLLIVAVELLLLGLLVWLIVVGVRLAKQTLAYAKSLLVHTSMNTVNAINQLGKAVKEKEN